jgi:hypothetical protein
MEINLLSFYMSPKNENLDKSQENETI